LQGRAFLDRNHDVTGATVGVRLPDDPSKVFITSTDEHGHFRIEGLPDGEYNVHLQREGLVPLTKDKVVLRFPFRAVVEVKMEVATDRSDVVPAQPAVNTTGTNELRRVRGRILERDGDPIGEIYMRLVQADGLQDPRYLRSGEDGSFDAAGLMSGRWRVQIRGVGYLPLRAEFNLVRDLDVLVYLVPQPANYEASPLDLMMPEQPLPPLGLMPFD
jgi:hypothetical protein